MRGGGTSGLADGISTSPLPYHWNSRSKPLSFGPAMYPSSDIVPPVVTLPISWSPSLLAVLSTRRTAGYLRTGSLESPGRRTQ
jgi:hypothetical protein